MFNSLLLLWAIEFPLYLHSFLCFGVNEISSSFDCVLPLNAKNVSYFYGILQIFELVNVYIFCVVSGLFYGVWHKILLVYIHYHVLCASKHLNDVSDGW